MNIYRWENCSKWLSRLLAVYQKQQLVDDPKNCLALFRRNKNDLFVRYVAMDESWILHFNLESNRQTAEWTIKSRPKRSKTQTPADKICVIGTFKKGIKKKLPRLQKKKTLSQLDCYHDKIEWNELRIVATPALFSRSSTQRLSVCRPQKDTEKKKIFIQ